MVNRNPARAGDEKMNPELRAEVQGLRGSIVTQAEKTPLPSRFTSEPDPGRPAMIITDTASGRSTSVGLCDYFGAIQVLSMFFPETEKGHENRREDREYPQGRGTDARLKRWLVDEGTNTAVREDGTNRVTLTGGQLYDLLFTVAEDMYWHGVRDVEGH